MKKFIFSIIVFLCVYTVVNADNRKDNVKLKFISESEQYASSTLTKKQLIGFGFELYGKLNEVSGSVANQEKNRKEKRLEKRLELLNDMEGSVELILEKYKLERKLEEERKKRRQRTINNNEISKDVSVGLILEGSKLFGGITNSGTSERTSVEKTIFEIGIRIDW